MTVKEILQRYNRQIDSNVINLGWENGWKKDSIDLHRELFDLADEYSLTKRGPDDWQEYEFSITEGNEVYFIKWQLDSND